MSKLEDIVSLCKRRGFIFPGSDVYGGFAGTWDFGPLGVELKRKITAEWWKYWVDTRENFYGIDAAILMNPRTWVASGHAATFADPLVECNECKSRFRADKLVDGFSESITTEEFHATHTKCPNCGKENWGPIRKFNMMFTTHVGAVLPEDATDNPELAAKNTAYLRPETAQGIFTNYKNVVDTLYPDLPFGLAQEGKSFRNEISPRDFILRDRECSQLEIEYFVNPADWEAVRPAARDLSDWWSTTSPIESTSARAHRAKLQTYIKRRQYTMLGGYITRALRNESEINRSCFGFVPLTIEAIWNQHPELGLQALTTGLNLREMSRRPREALMNWLGMLPPLLRTCPASASSAPVEHVIESIRANCALPYSQANLSRSLGLTPAYFCRLFHDKAGMHFSTFLTATRMEKAKELLAQAEVPPLQELSTACGYPNKSYFCQVFKKHTGMTPGEYEQQLKKDRK